MRLKYLLFFPVTFMLVSVVACEKQPEAPSQEVKVNAKSNQDLAMKGMDVPSSPRAVDEAAKAPPANGAAAFENENRPSQVGGGSQGAVKYAATGNEDEDDDKRERVCPCWETDGTLKFGVLKGTKLTENDDCYGAQQEPFSAWDVGLGNVIPPANAYKELEAESPNGDCEMKVGEEDSVGVGPTHLTCGYETNSEEVEAALNLTQAQADSCIDILCDLADESPCPNPKI